MYWRASQTILFRQMAQYTDTLIQLGGNTPSFSTTFQLFLSWCDSPCNHSCDLVQNRSGGQRSKAYEVVAQTEIPPTDWKKGSGSGTEYVAQRASQSSILKTESYHVCLENDDTMIQCPIAVGKDSLIAIREGNWKNILPSSFRRPFCQAWRGWRHQDSHRGDQGSGTQQNRVQPAVPQGRPRSSTSVAKKSELYA